MLWVLTRVVLRVTCRLVVMYTRRLWRVRLQIFRRLAMFMDHLNLPVVYLVRHMAALPYQKIGVRLDMSPAAQTIQVD